MKYHVFIESRVWSGFVHTSLRSFLDGICSQLSKTDTVLATVGDVPNEKDGDCDVLVLYNIPSRAMMPVQMGLERFLNRAKCRIVALMRDYHCDDVECSYCKLLDMLFERADMIIGHHYDYFCGKWGKFEYKFKWIPQFFDDNDCYGFKFPKKYGCLVPGAISKEIYPLRWKASTNPLSHVLKHPMYKKLDLNNTKDFCVGDWWVAKLGKHMCCVTCSSKYKLLLAKHVEIPAAGTVMLCDKISELTMMGLYPMKHYIPVTCDDVDNTIKSVLENYNEYSYIANDGQSFVLTNYSAAKVAEKCANKIRNML